MQILNDHIKSIQLCYHFILSKTCWVVVLYTVASRIIGTLDKYAQKYCKQKIYSNWHNNYFPKCVKYCDLLMIQWSQSLFIFGHFHIWQRWQPCAFFYKANRLSKLINNKKYVLGKMNSSLHLIHTVKYGGGSLMFCWQWSRGTI